MPLPAISGFDAILCCETLEHFEWDDVNTILDRFRQANARYLVVSVPYAGFQLDWRIYFNPHKAFSRFSFKKFGWLREFRKHTEPWGHKWEAGYKGCFLKMLEQKFSATGWAVQKRDFSSPCRSVFYVLERT